MALLDRHGQQQFRANRPLNIEGFQRHSHEVVVANQTDDIHQTLASELLNGLRVRVCTDLFLTHQFPGELNEQSFRRPQPCDGRQPRKILAGI